jgi:hypothetical protein
MKQSDLGKSLDSTVQPLLGFYGLQTLGWGLHFVGPTITLLLFCRTETGFSRTTFLVCFWFSKCLFLA